MRNGSGYFFILWELCIILPVPYKIEKSGTKLIKSHCAYLQEKLKSKKFGH